MRQVELQGRRCLTLEPTFKPHNRIRQRNEHLQSPEAISLDDGEPIVSWEALWIDMGGES